MFSSNEEYRTDFFFRQEVREFLCLRARSIVESERYSLPVEFPGANVCMLKHLLSELLQRVERLSNLIRTAEQIGELFDFE